MADPLRDAAQAPDVDWLLRQADLFIAMPDESWDTEALVSTLTDALRAALAAADTTPAVLLRGTWGDLAYGWRRAEVWMEHPIDTEVEVVLAAADGTTTPTPDLIALVTEAIRNPHEHTPRGADGLDVARWQARAVLAAIGATPALWEGPLADLVAQLDYGSIGPVLEAVRSRAPTARVRVVVATPATETEHG